MGWEIDVISLFDEIGVDYRVRGTNVAANDINIDCPWCGDSRKHLAVHRQKGYLNCWVCGLEGESPRPTLVDLIMELDGCSRVEAGILVKEFREDNIHRRRQNELAEKGVKKDREGVSLPPGSVPLSSKGHQVARARIYLAARGFGVERLERYGVRVCVSGFYAGRVIVPVYFRGELVSWLGRDYTGCSKLRYRNCPVAKAAMRNKDILYGFDLVEPGGRLMIVEGVTDVWRMDDGETIAAFTNKLHRNQLRLIIRDIRPRRVVFAFDGEYDSYVHARKAASALYPLVEELKILNLEGRDVAERGRDEIYRLEMEAEKFF